MKSCMDHINDLHITLPNCGEDDEDDVDFYDEVDDEEDDENTPTVSEEQLIQRVENLRLVLDLLMKRDGLSSASLPAKLAHCTFGCFSNSVPVHRLEVETIIVFS
jgi:hypothetical protein